VEKASALFLSVMPKLVSRFAMGRPADTIDIRTKVMIVAAPNGARATKADNPNIPIDPAEIAEQICECAKAGAAIAHFHARSADGSPTQNREIYQEIIERVRRESDIVIQVSIGGRGFGIEELLEPLDLKPEAGSFPVNEFIDAPHRQAELALMATRFRERNVRPEFDIRDSRGSAFAAAIIRDYGFGPPHCFGVVLRDLAPDADLNTLLKAISASLPSGAHWWVMKGGERAIEGAQIALSLGGHLRAGLEDSLTERNASGRWFDNVTLVDRAAALVRASGRSIAAPQDARVMLGLA
jgi:3-keto-5-aminohexanoate cleavage enzyme